MCAATPSGSELSCDSLGYEDAGRNIVATAGSLSTAAQVYQPMRVVAELDGPLRAALPGLPQLWLDWDNLRASARLARPLPQILSVEAGGFAGQTDPDEGDPVMLFSAEKVEGHLRPKGADLDAAGSFAGLEIDAAAVGGRTVPVFNGSGDARLANGVAFVLSRRQACAASPAQSATSICRLARTPAFRSAEHFRSARTGCSMPT